jgi:hypothetical protein
MLPRSIRGTEGFVADPATSARRVWRRSSGPALASGVTAILIGILALGLFGVSALVFRMPGGQQVTGFMLVLVAFTGALAAHVWRDMRGKRGGSIILDRHTLTLQLSRGRSLIHDPPACRETIDLADIKAVETRLECYGAQGLGMVQRAYRLVRRDGASIFLFEERALASALQDPSLRPVAQAIAEAAGVPLNDLGMVAGRGGFLGVWFARPPCWSATPMNSGMQSDFRRRVYLTGAVTAISLAVVWMVAALS